MYEDEEDISEPNLDFPVDHSPAASPQPASLSVTSDRLRTGSLSRIERLKNIFSNGTSRLLKPTLPGLVATVSAPEVQTSISPREQVQLARSPFRSGDKPHLRLSEENLPMSDSPSAKSLNSEIAIEEWRQTSQKLQQMTSIIEWKDKRITKLENTIKRMQYGDSEREPASTDIFENKRADSGEDYSALDEEYARNIVLLLAETDFCSDEEADETDTEAIHPGSPVDVNEIIRSKIEERTEQLNDARKDLWTVTIQYEELEEDLNKSQAELSRRCIELAGCSDVMTGLQETIINLESKLFAAERTVVPIEGKGDFQLDLETTDHSKMIEYVRILETDLAQKEWSVRTAEDEIRALRFVVEETNYCKANLEAELMTKSDLLNKSDYGAHVLSSLLEQADHQRLFLEDSLGEQTTKMLALREQLDESFIYQGLIEKEGLEKDECKAKTAEENRIQTLELDEWKLALKDAQHDISHLNSVIQEKVINQMENGEKLREFRAANGLLQLNLQESKSTIQEMEEQQSTRDTDSQQAKDDAAKLSYELQQIKCQTTYLKEELTSATTELERVTGKHHTVQLELATVSDDRFNMHAELKKAKNMLNSLQEECDLLRTDLGKRECDKAALEKDLTEVFEKTRQINHEKVFLRSQLEQERKNNSELEEHLDTSLIKSAAETAHLQATVEQLEQTLKSQSNGALESEQQLSRLQRTVMELQENEDQYKNSAADQLRELTEAEELISTLRLDMDAIKHSHARLAEEFANSRRESEELQAVNAFHKDTNSTVDTKTYTLENEMTPLRQSAHQTDSSSHEVESQQSISQKRISSLQDELSKKDSDIIEAKHLIQTLQDEMDSSVQNLEAQLNKSQAERFQADNDIAFFRSKIADFETEKKAAQIDIQTDLQTSHTANKILHVCLENLTTKAEELQSDLDSAVNGKQAMERELSEVNRQLETLNSMLEIAVADDVQSLPGSTVLEQTDFQVKRQGELDSNKANRKDRENNMAQNFETGDTDKVTLFNAIAESKSLLERQLQEKKRECELAQAEIAALRSDNSCLEMRHSDFAANAGTQHEALLEAAVELAAVRECLREDLQGVQESSRQAALGQERLLNNIRRDLSDLSTGFLRKNFGPGSEQERLFRIMVQKLTDFTNLAVHKITDEAEKNSSKFRRLLRRNVKIMDAILKKLDQIDHSTSAFEILASGAENYAEMTKELKKALRQVHSGRPTKSSAAVVKTPILDLEKHLQQLRDFLALIRHSPKTNTNEPSTQKTKSISHTSGSTGTTESRRTESSSPCQSEDEPKEDIEVVRQRLVRADEELRHWRSLAIRRSSTSLLRTDSHHADTSNHPGDGQHRTTRKKDTAPAVSKENSYRLRKALVDGCSCALNESQSLYSVPHRRKRLSGYNSPGLSKVQINNPSQRECK